MYCWHSICCGNPRSAYIVFSASSVTEIWGLLALRLANDPVLPFDYQAYTSQLQVH